MLISQEIEAIQTDRPDQTETSSLVPPNYFQAEIGFQYESSNHKDALIDHPNILLKYGVNNRFEIRLLSRVYSESINGEYAINMNELGIGFKTKICDAYKWIPKISFISHSQLFWNKSTRKIEFAPDCRFTFLHAIHAKLNLSYNLGMEWNLTNQTPTFLYTLSLAYAISNNIGIYIESYAFFEQQQKAIHLMDGGFTFLLNKHIQLDISAGTTLHQKNITYFVSTGISFRKKIKRD